MKNNASMGRMLRGLAFWGMIFPVSLALADTEINLDDDVKPTPVPTVKPTPVPAVQPAPAPGKSGSRPVVQPAPVAPVSKDQTNTPAVPASTHKDDEQEATPTVVEIQGTLKMKDVYAAGIKAYQDLDYDTAIRYLDQSLKMSDPYSPKFYYAEAAAMLGVIYQFHIIHNDKALRYYEMALQYEKDNRTAKRHLPEVKKLIRAGE